MALGFNEECVRDVVLYNSLSLFITFSPLPSFFLVRLLSRFGVSAQCNAEHFFSPQFDGDPKFPDLVIIWPCKGRAGGAVR